LPTLTPGSPRHSYGTANLSSTHSRHIAASEELQGFLATTFPFSHT
jgi:hypothetical protein